MSAGKGDKRRPRQCSQAQFDENWRRVFGDDDIRLSARVIPFPAPLAVAATGHPSR